MQICDEEDLPIPDHSRLWSELFLQAGSPAELHFTLSTRNFLKICIDEIIHCAFVRLEDDRDADVAASALEAHNDDNGTGSGSVNGVDGDLGLKSTNTWMQ